MIAGPQPSGVIFDVDGTLVDTIDQHADAWDAALREHGVSVSRERIREQYGKRNVETIQALLGNQVSPALIMAIDERKVELFRRHIGEVRPFPGAKELIMTLSATGVRIAVSSSAEYDDLQRFLEILGVAEVVTDRVSAKDVARSKPDPESFDLIITKWAIQARNVVVVGDSVFDMQAAARCGAFPVAVLTGGFSSESLHAAGARRIYGSVLDICQEMPGALRLGSE